MQIKLLTYACICALATTSFAQTDPDPEDALQSLVSEVFIVASVLATALPESLLDEANTNEELYPSHISSILDPDATPYPDWVEALPSGVKDFLELDADATGGGEEASETSRGGAAAPTMMVGMGVAGAVGLIGLLVL